MPDPTPAAQGPQVGQRADPYRNYNFRVQFDSNNEGYFIQCSGLGVEVTAIPYREGGDGRTVHQLAGPVKVGEITLRYGLTDSRVLWDWFSTALTGLPQRKQVALILQGPDGAGEKMRFNLVDAWPRKFVGAQLDASGNEIAIESLTLVCERIERA